MTTSVWVKIDNLLFSFLSPSFAWEIIKMLFTKFAEKKTHHARKNVRDQCNNVNNMEISINVNNNKGSL
jgi:hypothetical protein